MPPKDGGQDTAHNKPDEKAKGQAKNDLRPQDDGFIEKFVALFGKILLFGGPATGLWVIAERLDVHGFKQLANVFCSISAGLFFCTIPLMVLEYWPKPKKLVWTASLFLAPIVAIICFVERKEPTNKQPHIMSVAEMFDSDFERMLRSESGTTHPGFTNTIRFQLCRDFESKSEFGAAYISHSPYTYEICVTLASAIPRLASNIQASGIVWGGYVWDTTTVASTNLVFTGAIFLYCDDSLALEQAGDLVRIYRSNNFTLQLRDGKYAMMRNIAANK